MTYPDMVAFAEHVESRPLFKLLDELPELAQLSETKFKITLNVLRRRFRGESPVDQLQLRVIANEIAGNAGDAELARRIRSVFEFDRA